MRYVEDGIRENFAKLTLPGLGRPIDDLTKEELWDFLYKNTVPTGARRKAFVPRDNEPEKPEPEKVPLSVYEMPIDELELTVRAQHGLKRSGITTVGQLCKMTEEDLRRIRNLGLKTMREIVTRLGELGLGLRC